MPWLPVLVAIDAALVAAVLLLVLLLPRGGVQERPAPLGATTSAPAAAASPEPTATPGPPRFQTPSGNIACDMTADDVTCTIASITFTPPAVEGCDGVVGHTVVLDEGGVSVPCVDGPAPGVASADVPVLFYGEASRVGPYTCVSGTNGVTCTDTDGRGFRLARAELAQLP